MLQKTLLTQTLVTAVGGGMNSVVVENDQMAAEAMALLKSKRLGRATFLPLNKMQANRPSGKAAMSANKPGVLGFAHELLDYDLELLQRSLMHYGIL